MGVLRWGVLWLLLWAFIGCNQQEDLSVGEVEDGEEWISKHVSVDPKRPEPIAPGQTIRISARVVLLDDARVAWSSSAPEVATVDQDGVVQALGPGVAKIVATSRAKPIARSTATVRVEDEAQPTPSPDPSLKTISYTASSEDFPNPERGFNIFSLVDYPNPARLQEQFRQGYRLARSDVMLDRWRTSNLPPDFLNRLNAGFATIRKAGMKVVLRFMYNSPAVGGDYRGAQDAPLSWVLTHIKQLEPILRRNADVIAVLQGGFIGAWGEWHTSAYGLTSPQNKTAILNALLAALPSERMVQVRYVGDLIERHPSPLSASDSHNGSAKARTALVNNCLLATDTDAGTYASFQLNAHKEYLSKASGYMVIGGETCEVNAANNRAACTIAIPEMARFHWSYLNSLFYRPVLDRWKNEGCYGEISKRLGYRLRLEKAQLPQSARAGGLLNGVLTVVNDGFAAPYNLREVELVLRGQSGRVVRLDLAPDLRLWLPGSHTLTVRTTLPGNLEDGSYELLLNFPDPAPALAGRPEYSIRLANQGVWEGNTGFNRLGHRLSVN
jgi:hypothetical protein